MDFIEYIGIIQDLNSIVIEINNIYSYYCKHLRAIQYNSQVTY